MGIGIVVRFLSVNNSVYLYAFVRENGVTPYGHISVAADDRELADSEMRKRGYTIINPLSRKRWV
jgi:hypothetical protein